MTREDFSNSFDIQLNSYAHTASFGDDTFKGDIRLDEYEKSLFLTKAQEELVLSLYNGRNSSLQGFEETEELRRYLSNLIEEKKISPIETSDGKPLGMESSSKFFTLPEDLWFITYESVIISDGKCENTTSMEVVPVRQDEYHRLKKNPFRGANDRRSLRLDLGDDNVEIVSKYKVTKYYIRYLRKVKPIILVNLSDGLEIQGESTATDCELHESLHERILEMAVMMALQSKGYNVSKNNNENR